MIEQSKRKDWLKNKTTVAKTLIKEPLLTDREVAKKTWIGKSSVNRAKKELGQDGTKDIDIMERVLTMDNEILDLVNWLHLRDIKKKVEDWTELTLQDHKILWDLANNSTKRKAIFWSKEWKPVWEVIIQL